MTTDPTRGDPDLGRRAGGVSGRLLMAGLTAAAIVVAIALAAVLVNARGGQPAAAGPGAVSPSASGTPAAPSSVATTPGATTRIISRDEAVAAAEKFMGRPLNAAAVADPTTWPAGEYVEVSEPAGAVLRVEVATGRVVYMFLPAHQTATVKLTARQAEDAAAAFLTSHGVPFEGLTANVVLEDHGCCKLYQVTWQRFVGGAEVPDSRLVGLDPENGQVFSFSDRRVPYGAVASPSLGRDDAIARAISASRLSSPTVEEVKLMISSSPIWPGRLVWSVQLAAQIPLSSDGGGGYVSAVWVYVDAVTGETIIAGQG